MKSKTSFFNKTVFKKNVTLYWPVWGCFLLAELIKGPVYLWVRYQGYDGNKLECLMQSIDLKVDILLVACASIVFGMALFNYLFVSKSANMIHAMPVTRLELYGTNILSGLMFLLVPQLLTFGLSVFVSLSYGVAQVQYLGMWLLVNWGMSLFFFAMAAFCAMFTGQLFALPVYFVICNILVEGIMTGASLLTTMMAYGVDGSLFQTGRFRWLSPAVYMLDRIQFAGVYRAVRGNGGYTLSGIRLEGGTAVAGYVAAAVVLYILAYRCYCGRDIESAGDLLTFGWIKPVFRWGVGACVGFLSGTLLMGILDSVVTNVPAWVWAILVLVVSAVAFFMAEMLVQKSFRVISRYRCRECGIFLCFTGIVFAGLYVYAYQASNYIPKADRVEYAYIDMNYPVEFSGVDVEQIIELHREVLTRQEQIADTLRQNGESVYVSFVYQMKNGSVVSRSYEMPVGQDVSDHVIGTVYAWEMQPENFLRSRIEYDYREVKRFSDGQLECRGENADEYICRDIGSEAARKLYAAVTADLEAGTLQRYNVTDYTEYGVMRESGHYAYLYLNFYHAGKNSQTMYDRMYNRKKGPEEEGSSSEEMSFVEVASSTVSGDLYRDSLSVCFGADCENIVQTLVDCGIVDTADDIMYLSK